MNNDKTWMHLDQLNAPTQVLSGDDLEQELIIVANRGPVTFEQLPDNSFQFERGAGGLVTALSGLLQNVKAGWIACARTPADELWRQGMVPMGEQGGQVEVQFLSPDPEAYRGYYNVIANPLLWFLQHSMWNVTLEPVINRETWQAWENGYVAVNQLFAQAVAQRARQASGRKPLVMLQDYHLYLVARYLRDALRADERPPVLHFIHIPWPGPEYWRILPPTMRQAILDSLCMVDVLCFQTKDDGLNFIRTCESLLPRSHVNFKHGRIWYRNHATYVRDFPISIDVEAIKALAASDEVAAHRTELADLASGRQLVVRVDRIEPSKNIVRGFQAFEELLKLYPEHREQVIFIAALVPSRMGTEEYREY